ncbi:MAG: ABC transporter ATP-binding protein [Pseudomonadota bacterium]
MTPADVAPQTTSAATQDAQDAQDAQPILQIRKLETFYGKIQALRGIDLDLGRGEIATIIGANGAGKTTLMMPVCGTPRARAGSIQFEGQEIAGLPTHQIMHMGLAQSPEGRRIFPRMSVFENLQMGSILNPKAEQTFDQDVVRAYELFPILKTRENQRAGTMSGGEQQMLAIARALMGWPRLLMLDEPSLGLAPMILKQIFEVIGELNRGEGLTVFVVEQNAYHALKLAHRGYVMVNGDITLSGSGDELLHRPEIRAAYLEGGAH